MAMRRNLTDQFRAKVALEALRGDKGSKGEPGKKAIYDPTRPPQVEHPLPGKRFAPQICREGASGAVWCSSADLHSTIRRSGSMPKRLR